MPPPRRTLYASHAIFDHAFASRAVAERVIHETCRDAGPQLIRQPIERFRRIQRAAVPRRRDHITGQITPNRLFHAIDDAALGDDASEVGVG